MACLAALFAGTAVSPAPAAAQSGPRTVPHISSFVLQSSAKGWTAFVRVVDLQGGKALGALDVRLKGAGRATFTAMTETARAGTYALPLPAAEPGWVRLALHVRPGPEGAGMTGFAETYVRTLRSGRDLHVVASSASGPSADPARPGLFVGGIAALLLVGFMCSVLAIRSRGPAPERTLSNT